MDKNAIMSANQHEPDKQVVDGDAGPNDCEPRNATCSDDTWEKVYLFDSQSMDHDEDHSYDGDEEIPTLDEATVPQRISHKHSLYKVLDEDLLKQMTVSMIKLNYIWTQVGTELNDAEKTIRRMQAKLVEAVQQFVDQEDAKYRFYCKQIRSLKIKVETLLEDLAVFATEDLLQQWMHSSDSKQREEVQMGNCLRGQIAFLHKRYHGLVQHRDQHLRQFESLKNQLKSLLEKLGLPLSVDIQCERIMAKRVATYAEMHHLKETIEQYQIELEERWQHCRRISEEVHNMAILVPLHIEPSHLMLSNEDNFILSEKAQLRLDQLYEGALRSTQNAWHQLLDMFEQVDKLYRLFEVESDLRHPYFNTIEQLTKEQDLTSDAPWLIFHRDQKVTLLKAAEDLMHERDDYLLLKSERITELIGSIRKQISALLAECLVKVDSLQNDDRFQFLFTANALNEEETLNMHEQELDRLQQYHNKYKSILSLLTQWREQKCSLLECDQLLQNGNNYRNRGGILQQLLTKQRVLKKKIQQSVKQIGAWLQEQLNTKITDEDSEYDSLPFHLYNLRVEDIAEEVGPALLQQQQQQATRIQKAARSSILLTPASHMTPAAKRTLPFTKQKLFSNSSLLMSKSVGSRFKDAHSGLGTSTRKVPPNSAYINRFK